MNELVTLFDAFYSRFVLRDLFAKIVPGMMLLSAMAMSLTSSSSVLTYVASVSFWFWIAIFSAAWIIAFAVQALAEKYDLIRYYPKGLEQIQIYDMLIQFYKISSVLEKQQIERLVVIKEACGNGYMALSISLLLLVVDGILDTYNVGTPLIQWIFSELFRVGHVFIVLLGAIYFLRKMHFIHVDRQHDYMVRVLRQYEHGATSGS